MEQTEKAVVLNARDNVATALANLSAGATMSLDIAGKTATVRLTGDVPFGHKFSLSRVEPGEPIIKYGEVIGTACSTISPGDYVHIHNVASTRGQSTAKGGAK